MGSEFEIGEAAINFLGIAGVRRDFEQMAQTFPTVEKSELKEAIRAVQPADQGSFMNWFFTSVLIRIPGHTVLVDTGFGFSGGGPGLGTDPLLRESGVPPEEVNTVVITHGHGDHIGGLTEGGSPAMPDARIVISKKELEFWMGGEAEHLFGAESCSAQRNAFSICGDQIEGIEMDASIAGSTDTSIRAFPAPGHTPGHIGIEVSSGGQRLWLLVDTIHTLFQLSHIDWSPRFDVNPELARATAKELLGQASKRQIPVHLYHFPFPGIGTIREEETALAFLPIEC
jgi:glyoxylase-like metal-dependent hydrolase (beta-lactamase superfamily II)